MLEASSKAKYIRTSAQKAGLVMDLIRNQKRRLDEDDLYVSACYADQGPSQKRVRPAPMGRAYRVIKRSAHLTVRVAERESK
jgi:large subunit ribosomal protein L22